jgi:hypothetical protein
MSEVPNQDIVNEIFKSTGSIDSKGHSKLRRKEIVDRYREEKMKDFQYRKLRALYGTRHTQILFPVDKQYERKRTNDEFPVASVNGETSFSSSTSQTDSFIDVVESEKANRPLTDRIIIGAESRWKSYFDVGILLLVGYSCSTTMFYVAFT